MQPPSSLSVPSQHSSRSLDHGDEEPVGAVPGGRKEQAATARPGGIGWLAAHALFPRRPPGQLGKLPMVRQEPRHLIVILLRQHRAGHVDKPAPWPEQRSREPQDRTLFLLPLQDAGRLQPPFGIGAPSPRSAAGAWGINEHDVEAWTQRRDELLDAAGRLHEAIERTTALGGRGEDGADALTPEVLDRAMTFISTFSGQDFQSRRFLSGLLGYVKAYHPQIADHLRKTREAGHIILPGQSFIPPPAPESHVHGPGCEHHH